MGTYLLQLFDAEKLELLKTYRTERPVNSASISPIRDHVRLYGGPYYNFRWRGNGEEGGGGKTHFGDQKSKNNYIHCS